MIRLDPATLDRLLAEGGRFVLYKHSPSCGTSIWTREHMEAFARRRTEVPVYWVDVIGQRALSLDAARRLGVVHASPQAILVVAGEAVWDASHMGVTADAVDRAVGTRRGGR